MFVAFARARAPTEHRKNRVVSHTNPPESISLCTLPVGPSGFSLLV